MRWPEGPPHLALYPLYFICFCFFVFYFLFFFLFFFFSLSLLLLEKTLFSPQKGHIYVFFLYLPLFLFSLVSLSPFSLSLSLLLSCFLPFCFCYSLYNQKALRELGTVPPRELGTAPPLGEPLSHYKNRLFEDFGVNTWSQLVCLGFRFFFSQLGTFLGFFFFRHVFSDIQQPLFFESLFMRQFVKFVFQQTLWNSFLRAFFQSKTNKNHWSLVANSCFTRKFGCCWRSQFVFFIALKPLFYLQEAGFWKLPDFVPVVGSLIGH